MQSGSMRSLDAVLSRLDTLIDTGDDAGSLGRDLFSVVGVLDSEPSVRRVLTEPSVVAEARRGLARALLEGKVSEAAVKVVEYAVSERWSRTRDLVEGLEWAAVTAEAARADRSGELDALEDDLFRFGRILEANPRLRDALADRAAPLDAKRRLLDNLLAGKVSTVTQDLLGELITGRQRSIAAGLERYQEIAAALRQRLVATVWVAAPLSGDQRQRMAGLLSRDYGREVHLNVIVDPSVLGGVRVALGDDVIDSTIQTKMAQAQRLLAR